MAPSLAVFCPQSKAPQSEYLRGVQHFIRNHQHLRLLVESIQTLDQTWQLLADDHTDLHVLEQGPRYMRCFSEWITNGVSDPLANVMSGIISLPLLVIVQVTQYFQFLELSGTTHEQFLAGLRENGGGMQGYCAGLLPAFVIASAKDEADVVVKAANAMRLALAIGAYGELGDDASLDGPTTIVVRLSQPGLGEDLVAQFPGVSTPAPDAFPETYAKNKGLYLCYHGSQDYQYCGLCPDTREAVREGPGARSACLSYAPPRQSPQP